MNQEALMNIVEERNDLRDCLRKAGFEEGKHYNLKSYLDTSDDIRNVSTLIRVNEDVYNDEHKKIYDTITAFHEPRTGRMVEDNEGRCTFSISTKIDEGAYQELSKCQETSEEGNLEAAIAGFNSEAANDAHTNPSDCEINPQVTLSEVSSKSNGSQKTIMGHVKDTVRDRNAQMDAVGIAALAAVATGGILMMKKYRETPIQEGESRLHKVKRVMSSTFKERRAWFKIAGVSLLAYGVSLGCQAGKRMVSSK